MKNLTVSRIVIIQAVVLFAGILLLSRPDVKSMTATEVAPTSTIAAPDVTQYAIKVQAPTTTTQPSQPLVDLSGVDWTALARHIHGRCGEYYQTAMQAGWTPDQWPTISKVMYRESRCNFDSFNPTDPNGGSRGLMQINGFWCRPNRYTPNGFLQDRGVLSTCDDLYNPDVVMRAAREIWLYSQERNGCGWRPWATPCR